MSPLKTLSIPILIAFAGCLADTNSATKPTIYLQNEKALACPLCKRPPTIIKMYVSDRRGLKIPSNADDPEYLYSIGCKTKGCPVASGLGPNVWREDEAVELWNGYVRPYLKVD